MEKSLRLEISRETKMVTSIIVTTDQAPVLSQNLSSERKEGEQEKEVGKKFFPK